MKKLFVAAILALPQIIPAAAQEPNVETFARSRAHFVGLFEASVAKIGGGPASRTGAASGESADTLQLTASDSDSQSEYRQLLTAWEYHLPRMLEAARNKPVQ